MTSKFNGTQILKGLVNNDQTIYNYISTTYLPLIKGMLTNKGLSYCQLENRSREVLQETICQIWILAKTKDRYQETSAFKAWFMAIASRVAATVHRKYKVLETIPIESGISKNEVANNFEAQSMSASTSSSETSIIDLHDLEQFIYRKLNLEKFPSVLCLELGWVETAMLTEQQLERLQIIDEHFKRLTPVEQCVLKLYWKDRLLISEIAGFLNKTEANVKVILYRGKKNYELGVIAIKGNEWNQNF